MKIFITGGGGTIGQELTRRLYHIAEKIVIFSRDEAKQAAMRETFPEGPPGPMRYRIGDIRDGGRTIYAMRDCDTVIHAAAMKRIDTCESEVYECLKTNIEGTANVAQSCNALGIKNATFISTDKACDPISAYGCAKAFSEHIWIQSNNYGSCRFNALRYGNVSGSKGSVHALWERNRGRRLKVTSAEMTRFFWSIEEASDFCLRFIDTPERGIIFIPKMESRRIIDVAMDFSDDIEITGIRCAEKIHERLISETDIRSGAARDCGDHWRIYPINHAWQAEMVREGLRVDPDWKVTSETN
jgi:UDP-N-acetylglucosamine 4,6-dehydratase